LKKQNIHTFKNPHKENLGGWLFNQKALQEYLIFCCQELEGGLRDKPGKKRDYYHTCYCLSGMSVAQHNPPEYTPATTVHNNSSTNLLKPTDALYNIGPNQVIKAKEYFGSLQQIDL